MTSCDIHMTNHMTCTLSTEMFQCHVTRTMIDEVTTREKSKGIKKFEYRIPRLMNRHNNNTFTVVITQSVMRQFVSITLSK